MTHHVRWLRPILIPFMKRGYDYGSRFRFSPGVSIGLKSTVTGSDVPITEQKWPDALSAADISKFRYRNATLADYDAVMAIGTDLFDGLDYLPGTYKTLFEDPTWSALILTQGERVVGFFGGHIVNGGKAAMFRSGRIVEDLRSKGIMSAVIRTGNMDYVKKNPDLAEFYSTLKSDSFFFNTTYYNKPDCNVFLRKCVAYTIDDPRGFDETATKVDNGRDAPVEVDRGMMGDIFDDPLANRTLFPDSFISARYIFTSPSNENLDLLCRYADHRAATFAADGRCRLLTFGIHFPCTAGYAYHTEVYGEPSPELVLPHIRHHLRAATSAASLHSNARLFFFVYGRKGDFDFTWLERPMGDLRAVPYNLSYEFYVGLRNYRDDKDWMPIV